MPLTLDDARALVRSCQAEAADYGKALSIAVVDSGGYLIMLERQYGARPLTPYVAISKAYTAAVMQRPGWMLKRDFAEADPALFSQVAQMGLEPLAAAVAAMPIKKDGEVLGGLGIHGGVPDNAQSICEAALTACGYELDFEDDW